MKKSLSLALLMSVAFGVSAVGCDSSSGETLTKDNVQIGLICLHDETSTYDLNFINSMYNALDNLGISRNQLKLSTGIAEGNECYDEATKMAASCNVIFGDSFGHEDYLIQAAQENPNVRFAHATGTKAHSYKLDNFSNAFASIYEGRYLAGIVAGTKLNEQIENGEFTAEEAVIGYVGAWSFAEVISGFTSFYLGARSVCPSVTMKVKFTGSWYDYDLEYEAANALIEEGCKLISGHADSYGAPNACEEAYEAGNHVYNVAYNGSTASKCPNTYLVSSKIDWTPYFEYMITQTIKGEQIMTDYVGDISTGSVTLADYGTGVSQTAKDSVEAAKAQLVSKELKVFDTSKFTVAGQVLTEYMADVDYDENYTGDTQVVADGYFHESEYRAGPYFDVKIDGIEWLNSAY